GCQSVTSISSWARPCAPGGAGTSRGSSSSLSFPPRQQARQAPLIHRLALAADARSAQRVLGGGDGLRRGRRQGRLQRRSYPAHHGEKLLAAVRAEIGHTVGWSRIRRHLTPSFVAAGLAASLHICGVERRSSASRSTTCAPGWVRLAGV